MSREHRTAQTYPSAGLASRKLLGKNGDGAPDPRDWLAALIQGSDDAIVSRNLSGIIQSWNGAATRLFGYSADEMIGRSIMILVPDDRLEEASTVLAQFQCGKRVNRLETKRRRKDGSLIDISLMISVIRNEDNVIVGASMIAHDITERLVVQERQQLLMGEMRHRVKNLFALAAAIVSISAKSSGIGGSLIDDIRARLSSLARAHDMAMADRPHNASDRQALSLLTLVRKILDPYATTDGGIAISGDDCDVGAGAIPYLSLLLYELATNAAKFGSLSVGSGRLDVSFVSDGNLVRLVWRETGGPVPSTGRPLGFGSQLERSVTCALNTTIERDWCLTGLVATIVIPKAVLLA